MRLLKKFPHNFTLRRKTSEQVESIPACQLLFLDPAGHADPLLRQLRLYTPHVSRWVVIHDTAIYAETAPGGGGPGLLPALRLFLAEHPEWFVARDTDRQYGLTVLSRHPVNRPAAPLPRSPLYSSLF